MAIAHMPSCDKECVKVSANLIQQFLRSSGLKDGTSFVKELQTLFSIRKPKEFGKYNVLNSMTQQLHIKCFI